MIYVIIGAMAFLALIMPVSIRNQTKYRQETIAKRARMLGIDLDFSETPKKQ